MQTAAAEDSLIGQALDNKYRIVRVIGQGGMGVVYEAEHATLGKRVAIKLMLEKYAGDNEAVARFTREAYAASRIGNPHIIDVMDIGTAPDGRSYVVMELLTGQPLSRLVEEGGPLVPTRAIGIMRQVLRAVGAAHAKGIVHRDLKPDNIFLVESGDGADFVKLLDFGISKMIDPDMQVAATKLTTTGVVMGTPLYMAPEQAMGADIDHLADVYACGVILYELLAGKPPFEGATYAVLVAKLLTTDPPLLNTHRPGLSPKLVAAVHKALEKDPQNRHVSADAFAASLPQPTSASSLELAHTQASGARAIVPQRPAGAKSGKGPVIAVSIALLAGIGTATAIILSQNKGGSTTTPSTQPEVKKSDPVVTPITPPAAESGLLTVHSTPPGATITVDGAPLEDGATITVTLGKHKIHAELLGWQPAEAEEEVVKGVRSAVLLPLVRQAATPPGKGPKVTKTPPSKQPSGQGKTPPTSPTDMEALTKAALPDEDHPPVVKTPGPGKTTPPIKRDDPPKTPPTGSGTTAPKPNPY